MYVKKCGTIRDSLIVFLKKTLKNQIKFVFLPLNKKGVRLGLALNLFLSEKFRIMAWETPNIFNYILLTW